MTTEQIAIPEPLFVALMRDYGALARKKGLLAGGLVERVEHLVTEYGVPGLKDSMLAAAFEGFRSALAPPITRNM